MCEIFFFFKNGKSSLTTTPTYEYFGNLDNTTTYKYIPYGFLDHRTPFYKFWKGHKQYWNKEKT